MKKWRVLEGSGDYLTDPDGCWDQAWPNPGVVEGVLGGSGSCRADGAGRTPVRPSDGGGRVVGGGLAGLARLRGSSPRQSTEPRPGFLTRARYRVTIQRRSQHGAGPER